MTQRLVVSLGGNAFARSGEPLSIAGQFSFAERTLAPLAALLDSDTQLLLTHGNGPQVGVILTRVEEALGKAYRLPLEVCVAESEGEMGYLLQQTLYNIGRGHRPVATVLTQVVVDAKDPAFDAPSKPIGPWFDAEQTATLTAAGVSLVYDEAGRGRRVVASPQPLRVVEAQVIARMLDLGIVAIAAGGGGIPVIEADDDRGRAGHRELRGIEAVVDKDFATALLAVELGADRLVLVTGVEGVFRDFGTARAQLLPRVHPDELEALAAQGQFPPGSMGPKVSAAVRYVRASGRPAIICQPSELAAALAGAAGTVVEGTRDV
ncbi:MAG: carbamate kinase [Halieaceae bacterium]|jgi:carbamate kinase|nr:carbamate kinase [Halieaceae bacterium]